MFSSKRVPFLVSLQHVWPLCLLTGASMIAAMSPLSWSVCSWSWQGHLPMGAPIALMGQLLASCGMPFPVCIHPSISKDAGLRGALTAPQGQIIVTVSCWTHTRLATAGSSVLMGTGHLGPCPSQQARWCSCSRVYMRRPCDSTMQLVWGCHQLEMWLALTASISRADAGCERWASIQLCMEQCHLQHQKPGQMAHVLSAAQPAI